MALGIDIYRYQTVTDWNAVKRHGVSFVYVKGTDGGGPAIVRADNQVRGAKGVLLPVGLYHYAQLSPTPEAQANVLTAEIRRLNAIGMPPALDLEDPHRPGAVAKDFALRFIAQLRRNGFRTVMLYANTSMLTGIGGAEIDDDPNVLIWAASYGPDDGRRHELTYRGRVNIHQYTSVGKVPGISGLVDLNESLTALPGMQGDEDMPLTQADANLVVSTLMAWQVPNLDPGPGKPDSLPFGVLHYGNNMAGWGAVNRLIALETMVKQLAADQANDLNEDTARTLLQSAMGSPVEIAQHVAEELRPIIQAVLAEQAAKVDRVSDLDDREIAEAVARRIFAGPPPQQVIEGEVTG